MAEQSVVTCVFCGHAYPLDTPTHGAEVLETHIAACEKHPLTELRRKYIKVRKALVGLVGAESREELEQIEAAVRVIPVCDQDKAATLNAIHALLETTND